MAPTIAAFEEAHSAQFGRHLIANKLLSPGTTVLQQQPYASVLYDAHVPLRCDWCFQMPQSGSTLMRCTRSKFAHYCCKDHQKAAWKAYYKQECAALVACAPNVPPATVRLAARVLWRRDRCGGLFEMQLPSRNMHYVILIHLNLAAAGS